MCQKKHWVVHEEMDRRLKPEKEESENKVMEEKKPVSIFKYVCKIHGVQVSWCVRRCEGNTTVNA